MFEYIRLASKFGATEKLQTALTKVATAQIVDQFEPYFLDTKKSLPKDSERTAVEDYFLLALSRLSDEQKLEKQKKWYPSQYKSTTFTALSRLIYTLDEKFDEKKGDYRIRDVIVSAYFDKKIIAARDLWENSFERRVYKKLSDKHEDIPGFYADDLQKYIPRFLAGEPYFHDNNSSFLHAPIISLLLRTVVYQKLEPYSNYVSATFFWSHSKKFLYDVDIHSIGRIGDLLIKNRNHHIEILLHEKATIPWQSFNSLVGHTYEENDSNECKYTFTFICPQTLQPPIPDKSFHLSAPPTYRRIIFNIILQAFPYAWHVLHSNILLPYFNTKLIVLEKAYQHKVNLANYTIPTIIKEVGSFLLQNNNLLLNKIGLSLPEHIQWPPYTSDYKLITLGQLEEAKKAITLLNKITINPLHYLHTGLGFVSGYIPSVSVGFLTASAVIFCLINVYYKFNQEKSCDKLASHYTYRSLNGGKEPRAYSWFYVIISTLFGSKNIGAIKFKNASNPQIIGE